MKASLLIVLFLFSTILLSGQTNVQLYNPSADAKADIAEAVRKAKAENKHVLVQVGGNWCPWCIKLHHFMQENKSVDSILKASYVLVRVNYSKENKNLPLLAELGYPQRFGFPVLLVLDQNGKLIHTQDSGLLESGDGYDLNKIKIFLENWTVKALDPSNYK